VAPLVPDDKQFKEVYDGGLCTKTLTVDPTQEALRNQIVRNGGIGGVIAGEADIFRSLVAYSIVPGSLSLFLNGWDQGEINTTRVSDMDLHMKNAALSVCVLFQPEVFAEVTSGNVKATGSSADSFMARGMFGRFFTVETENVTDYLAMAAAYSDDNDFDNDPNDPNGYSTADGKITPLGSAAIDFDLALQDLVQDSNEYRMKTAIYQAWTAAENRYGTDLQVLEPEKPMRHSLHLEDPESRIAYRRCQKMMALVRAHIQQSDDPDTRTLWEPMASRLVQHALREALIMTLAAGRKSSPTDPLVKEPFHVTAEFIEDAATRILPWRMCMSANALTRRATERAEDVLAQAVTVTNPKMRDLTPSAMIRDLLFDLAADDRNLALSGMTKTEIHKRLQSRLPRGSARTSVSKLLTSALEELSADPTTGIAQVPGKPNALGKTGVRYTVRVPTNF
jgi:hypothetical protein